MDVSRNEDAIKDFNQVLNSAVPQLLYQAHFNKGVCFRRLGRIEESIKELENAIAKASDHPDGYDQLGRSLFENGEHDKAIIYFGKALSHDYRP